MGRLGPAGAPLPPLIEQHLKEAGTVAGRAEETVDPLARWRVGHRSWSGFGLPGALPALPAIGLLPRFAVRELPATATVVG
ncbi:hypothetical protein ACWCQS_26055 [Streptomyces sp. NPDC002076]